MLRAPTLKESDRYAGGMAQTLTSLLVHVVFSTKNRQPWITPEARAPLYRYMGGIARNHRSPMLAAGGVSDHVHLLISLSKNIALAPLVMDLKKDSSKWIKGEIGRRAFAWQDGYEGFTIGQSQVAALERYFERQEAHHRRVTFQDEMRAFFRKYHVAYDERYVWS